MLGSLRGMVIVPSRDAGRVSRGQHLVVDDVQGETAINREVAAFVFGFRNVSGRWGTTSHTFTMRIAQVYV